FSCFAPRQPPPMPRLFPYTTLFRSQMLSDHRRGEPSRLEPGASQVLVPAAQGMLEHIDVQGEGEGALLGEPRGEGGLAAARQVQDRKSTRLNSSHVSISYAVFCLKK